MSASTIRWFRVKRWPKGHIHISFACWFADWNPFTRRLTIRNRPWPGAKRGLPRSKMRYWAIKL